MANQSRAKTDEVEFTVKEFHTHSRNQFWYVGIGLLVLALGYVALAARDYLTLAVIVVSGIAVIRLSRLQPASRSVRLTQNGVYWGKQFLGFHQLRAFWTAPFNGGEIVYIERLNYALPLAISLPEPSVKPTIEYLGQYLPLHDHRGVPIAERVSHFLKL